MSALVEVTSHTGRLRHLARDEELHGWHGQGRYGKALCHNTIQTTVYDQQAFDWERQKWNAAYVSKPISALPLCKKCGKAGVA